MKTGICGLTALISSFFFMYLACAGIAQAEMLTPAPPQTSEGKIQEVAFTETILEWLDFNLQNFETIRPVPPVPKARPFTDSGKPFSSANASAYKRIFAYQAQGDMDKADEELASLKDLRLRGHVLYQRYMHPTAYHSTYEELSNWLALYNDYPGADRIYQIAARRGPEEGLIKPVTPSGLKAHYAADHQGYVYRSSQTRTSAQNAAVRKLSTDLRAMLAEDNIPGVSRLLEGKAFGLLDTAEQDMMKARVAAALMYRGDLEQAYELASQSARRSGLYVPQAGWVAGLVSWRLGHYREAAKFFEIRARSPYASGWGAAAGAYWAARAHMQAGDTRLAKAWLKRAAAQPRSFYGLISLRTLGQEFIFNWDVPAFDQAHARALEKTPEGQRAVALVAAGQKDMAEAELLRLAGDGDKSLQESLLSYASSAGMPGLAMRLGNAMEDEEGGFYDAALYPTGPWKPKAGYRIDPALIHAIMRQESRFDPEAESYKGARGLMQVMPVTAGGIAGKKGKEGLSDPETNLSIGQRYLEELLTKPYIAGDLFRLLIAYNAGPGNLQDWEKDVAGIDDPLLFIESIPSAETRNYVERVLANYWMYRLRDDLPTPTLDALAAGQNAIYAMTIKDGIFEMAASE